MAGRRNWTTNELLICLAFYATLDRGERRSPPSWVLKELSGLINRTTGSVSLRFANFSSVDPIFTKAGLKGMDGGGAHVKSIWSKCSKNDDELDPEKIMRALAKALATTTANLPVVTDDEK